jgi:outer membrane immunogenic protein
MRKLLASLSALALSAGVAHAGAMVAPPVEPVVTAPTPAPMAPMAQDWAGGYAGVGLTFGRASYGGGGFNASDIFDDIFDDQELPFFPSGSGWGGGAFVGFNWQNNNIVYGVEGHLSAHRMRGTETLDGDNGESVDIRTNVRSLASLRGRVGFAADRTLVFLTAGPAVGNVRHEAVGLDSESRNANGVVVGVGVEHALANGWNVRGDLEHYRFRSRDFTTGGEDFSGVRPRVNLARVSAVFRF